MVKNREEKKKKREGRGRTQDLVSFPFLFGDPQKTGYENPGGSASGTGWK